jgi:hypothetical protein
MRNPALWLGGGIAGVAGICCYIFAVAIPWSETQLGISASLIVISAFPVLNIVSSYALCNFIAAEKDSAANRLALVFAITGFTTLLAMIIVQLAVGAGVPEITRDLDPQMAKALRRGLRMIDLGLDVAWDILIGTALVLWGVALRKCKGLEKPWGRLAIVFGVALIGLNVVTFPWPPNTRGLFDIGPIIAIFMLGLSARLAFLGRRAMVAATAS